MIAACDEIPAQPVEWRLLLIIGVFQFLLHLLTNGNYGIFRDEYYYLSCADRLAWGYVDQPAFSIWLLSLWKLIFGQSVHAIRLLPALCGTALALLTGMTAAELGGGRWAQFLAGFGSLIGAAGLVVCGFYSMNCYDFLVWIGAYYLLIRIARTGDGRWWPWFGLLLGLGLFNKVGVLVFGVALMIGLLATQHRRHLRDLRLWIGGAVALAFLLPYVLWNMANDWPTREFIDNAKQYKIADIPPLEFLANNVLEANPTTLVLWLAGLLWLLIARPVRSFRIVSVMVIATWILLVLQKSKPYYFASSMPVLLAAGAVAWERWTAGSRRRWVRWLLFVNLFAGLAIFVPMGLPVLTPADLDEYQKRLGIAGTASEVGHTSSLPQYFSDRLGWENLARVVSDVYGELPADERTRAIALGRNYGHSGALEYWSRKYDLPVVYGRHNNFWLWGPPPADRDTVVITVGYNMDYLANFFDEVVEAGAARSTWALEDQMTIHVCKGLKRPIEEVWSEIKIYI